MTHETYEATMGHLLDDERIQREVVDALDADPGVAMHSVWVAVEDGIVTLTGVVGSRSERKAAEDASMRVGAVRGVVNELLVHSPEERISEDTRIARTAVHILQGDFHVPAERVTVSVSQGRVLLEGEVEYDSQRRRAGALVGRISGVTDVQNRIVVRGPTQAVSVNAPRD